MRFRPKPEYPVSHLSAIVSYAAQQRDLAAFNAYPYMEGMPISGIQDADLLQPGDYIIIAPDGTEWRSEKSFFESQYEPVL